MVIIVNALPATSRSRRAQSTMAPPGIWHSNATMPPMDSTKPMSVCVHFCVVR